jgi:hypothetical protein
MSSENWRCAILFVALIVVLGLWLATPLHASAQVPTASPWVDISDPAYGCIGDGKTVNTHCFTAAAAAACQAGGKAIFVPTGRFLFSGTGAELIKIPCGLNIVGSGWGSIIQVAGNVGNSTDVIHFAGTSEIRGCVLRDLQIIPQSGTPARYGINFDALGKYPISYCKIDHIRVGTFGDYAIASTNSSVPTGSPFTTTITDSYIAGGINFSNAGDSIRLTQNTITGPRSILLDQVGCGTSDNGAHLMYLADNNITADGGIQVLNGTTIRIVRNNIEQPRTSTEKNGALVDLDGNAACPIINAVIEENYLGATTKNVPTATIRVNYAEGTIISRNYAIRSGGTSKTYLITAHGKNTIISQERPVPNGELPATFLSDSGTNSFIEYYDGSGFHHLGKSTIGGASSK